MRIVLTFFYVIFSEFLIRYIDSRFLPLPIFFFEKRMNFVIFNCQILDFIVKYEKINMGGKDETQIKGHYRNG